MVKLLSCGHPNDWTIRLVGCGKRYRYCIGCMIEKLGLRPEESYDNPYIKYDREKEVVTPEVLVDEIKKGVKKETKKTKEKLVKEQTEKIVEEPNGHNTQEPEVPEKTKEIIKE